MADDKRTDLMEASEGLVLTLETVSSDAIKQMAEYKAYIAALGQINELSNELFKEEGDLGYPFVSKEKLQKLLDNYSNCAKAIKGLKTALEAKKDKDDATVAVLDLTDNVLSLLSKDFVTLKAYNPDKEQKTLPKLINDARIVTFDVTGLELKRVGGNLSSRFPLNYTKPDGTVIKGMFTRKEYVSPAPAFRKAIDAIVNAEPADNNPYKAFMNDYFEAVKAANTKNGRLDPKVTDEWLLTDLFKRIYGRDKNNRICASWGLMSNYMINVVTNYRNQKKIDNTNTKATGDAIKKLLTKDKAFVAAAKKIEFNRTSPGIAIGSRIDSRNSAMSTVADLLGKSDIIARAVPARVKRGDTIIEGTFMEYAPGMDANNMTDEEKKLDASIFNGSNGHRSAADLQVLDYICGNIDRHVANMMYNIDMKTKKCLGVIGIDNDASMGLYYPTNNKVGKNRLAALDTITAISESMANAVMALEPEVLDFALREYELSPKEIECCAKRLDNIKNLIKKVRANDKDACSRCKIIKDNEFRNYSVFSLSKPYKQYLTAPEKDDQYNIFGRLRYDLFNPRAIDALPAYREPKLAEVYDRSLKVSAKAVQKYVKTAEDMVTILNLRTAENRTSENYIALQAACNDYADYMKKVAKNKKSLDIDSISGMNERLVKIVAAADTYLEGKGKLTGRRNYTQKRIDAIIEIKQVAEKTIISSLSKEDLVVLIDKQEQDAVKAKEENRKEHMKEQEGIGLKK